MKEFLESNEGIKMMSMVICGIQYQDEKYLIYSILRNHSEVNLFVSRLVLTSTGYSCSSSFSNGEKEVLDSVVEKIISKVPLSFLEEDGYSLLNDIELTDSLSFDKDISYVSTISKSQLKDIFSFYHLNHEDVLESPTIKIKDDKGLFNKGSFLSILLVLFGLFVLVMSIYIVISVLIR